MKSTLRLFSLVLLAGLAAPLHADVKLPAIFSDHAVLQKTAKVPVWGKADPGEKVTVTLDGTKGEATAGTDGKWRVILDLSTKAAGPFTLNVEGKNKLVVNDVVVGEVWVCSGQSNMEFSLNSTIGAKEEMANSANPMLRQFLVTKNAAVTPTDDCVGTWVQASPSSTGYFTAAGYYFGKRLNQELKVPVGLISTYWGGSAAEAWTSGSTLDKNPDLKASKDRILNEINSLPQRMTEYEAAYKAWETKYSREDKAVGKPEDYAGVAVDTSTWKKVTMPQPFTKAGLPDAGAIWLRRTVTLPPSMAGQWVQLELGQINQFDTVYWNGEKISESTVKVPGSNSWRKYGVGGKFTKEGENVLAIRVQSPLGNGGLMDEKAPFKFGSIPLAGEWLAKVEYELPPLAEAGKSDYPKQPAKLIDKMSWPTCLYNGMIHPIQTYGIAGVIWYQGETNSGRAYQYRTTFPAMINDWRALWGQGDFPFYFCQLANFAAKKSMMEDSGWAELREAQTMTLALPNTGQAVLIDIGEEGDIHPRNKRDVGNRLAVIALAKTYGKKDVVFSGPVFDSMKIDGDKAIITFKYVDGGLVAQPLPATYEPKSLEPGKTSPLVLNSPGSELQGFAMCGEDKQWKWATAKIDKDTVIVTAEGISKPLAVRYAWAHNPTCNLYNKAGLPACPFRTDDFPGVTVNAKY